jgi:hypothetical protein
MDGTKRPAAPREAAEITRIAHRNQPKCKVAVFVGADGVVVAMPVLDSEPVVVGRPESSAEVETTCEATSVGFWFVGIGDDGANNAEVDGAEVAGGMGAVTLLLSLSAADWDGA